MKIWKEGDPCFVPIKNRWGLDCAATITKVYDEFVDATVWNMGGPGADGEITKIPIDVLIEDCNNKQNDEDYFQGLLDKINQK